MSSHKTTAAHPYGPTNTSVRWNQWGEREIWHSYDGGKTWTMVGVEKP